MRILRVTLAVAAALALGGCFQSTTVMKINADGSGTLEETVAITKAGLAQMQQFAALGGGRGARGLSDPLSEEQVRGATAALGPGVTFVGSRPVQTAEGEGRAITYAFTDVSLLGASQQPPMPGPGPGGRGSARPQDVYFAMTRRPNGNAVLTIRLPEPKLPSIPGRGGIEGGGDPTGTLPSRFPIGQLGMMTQMFAGARLAIAVEPHGRLVRSSSPFVEGQIVTLLDLDVDQLIKSDSALARIGAVHSLEDAKVAMQGIPGLKVSLDREIAIEFTPAQ